MYPYKTEVATIFTCYWFWEWAKMYICILTQATIKCAFLRDKSDIIINIIRQTKSVSWF